MGKIFVRSEFKMLIMLALPILCTQLLQVGMGVTDIAITGHFDSLVQSGVSMGVAIWNPVMLFVSGTLMGVAILTAHLYGANQSSRIVTVFHSGVLLSLCFSVIAITILWNARHILNFFEVDKNIIPYAVDYLKALSIGLPAIFLFNTLRTVCEGISRPLPVTIVTFFGFIVNGFANYYLVNGCAVIGLPSLGIIGSGLGTATAMWSMLIGLLLFTKADYRLKRLELFHYKARFLKRTKELLRIGLPNGFSVFSEVALFSVSGLILGKFGSTVVNSHQIALSITSVTFMVPLSLSISIIALVGKTMGGKAYKDAIRIAKMGRITCFFIMILTGIYLFTARNYLPMLFTNDVEVLELTAYILLFSVVFQIPDGLQISAAGALRGMKDTKFPMIIGLTAYWIIALPIGYYLGVIRNMQAEGVWIGLIVGLSCAAVLSNWRLHYHFKRLTQLIG